MTKIKTDKNQARARIEELVQDYIKFAASHNENDVNEEYVKIRSLVPLLEALGWNVRTDEILPEQRTLAGEMAASSGLKGI